MKRSKTNNLKLIIAILAVGVALVIMFGVAIAIKMHERKVNQMEEAARRNQTSQNQSQNDGGNQNNSNNPEDPGNNEQLKQPETPGKTPPKYQGQVQESPERIVGNIVTKRIIGDNLVINVMIREMIKGNGTCELELESRATGKKIEIKNRIMNDVSTSHCESFKIPRSSLGSGVWEIDIEMEAGRKKGEIKDEITL